jgi:hypothetical protein
MVLVVAVELLGEKAQWEEELAPVTVAVSVVAAVNVTEPGSAPLAAVTQVAARVR